MRAQHKKENETEEKTGNTLKTITYRNMESKEQESS